MRRNLSTMPNPINPNIDLETDYGPQGGASPSWGTARLMQAIYRVPAGQRAEVLKNLTALIVEGVGKVSESRLHEYRYLPHGALIVAYYGALLMEKTSEYGTD